MVERSSRAGHSIFIDDGTTWPDPFFDIREMDEPQRTFYINAVLGAYRHLAAHPAGTESCVKSLRSLRRGVKAVGRG